MNLSENLSGAHSESMPEQADTQAEQQRLQSLLLEISSALNNALPSCIDDELERCLQILIKALAVDRITVWRYSDHEQQFFSTHTRCADTVNSLPLASVSKQTVPWLTGQLQQHRSVAWSSRQELAAKAPTDVAMVDQTDNQSVLLMPLRAAARLLGALQFSTVRLQRAWPQTLMQPLALLANMIAGALERKQQHEYLSRPQDSKQHTDWFFENNIEGLWRVDFDQPIPVDLPEHEQVELIFKYGYFGEVNSALVQQYGAVSPEQLIGTRVAEFLPKALPRSVRALAKAVRSRYRISGLETVETDLNGTEKIFRQNMVGEIERGQLIHVWGSQSDVTEQRHLEKHMRNLSAAVEAVQDGCILVDAQDKEMPVVFVNAGFTTVTGYSAADVLGHNCRFLQGRDTDPDAIARLRTAISQGRACWCELLNYRKDGTPFWNLMRLSPIYDSDGLLTHYVGILSDITKRKQRELDNRQLRDELAHLARVNTLNELTGALAHEINQPLTAILCNAQAAERFLRSTQPDLEQLREILGDIVADDKRAGDIIKRLGWLLKKEASHFAVLDINQAIRDVLTLVRSDALIKHLRIIPTLAPDLPAVVGDRVQLQQVLLNLLTNAGQAMSDVNRSLIEITARQNEAHMIEVAVRDQGTGLSAKHSQDVFKPFFSTKAKGLGLGLSINQTIIESHGGRLWAENNPDYGATFRFTLPVAAALETMPPHAAAS